MDPDELANVFAIQQLKSRYFRCLDTKAWAQWRRLFTDDLIFYVEDSALPGDSPPTQVGADDFVSSVSETLQNAVTVHHGHMPEIELTGPDSARGVWAMYDWVDDAETGTAIQGWGHYHELYRREADGEWRIAELRLTRLRVDVVAATRPGGDRPWPAPWKPEASA